MSREERVRQIQELQEAREDSLVISYVTSTRSNLEAQMAMDVIPIIHRHLRAIDSSKDQTRIDLFIHSNGGDSTVPWRLVTLIREFCSELTVLVPYRAFSAATLLALGADKVVMHPMGMLGPTDPSVTTPFNPRSQQDPNRLLEIGVEDVSSYITLVKEDVGIRHEDELVEAFKILAQEVHPLALGSVKRSTSQSRLLGEKLLRLRSAKLGAHEEAEIIQKLTSQLYYHGHPINRIEARDDLGLEFVEDATHEVGEKMWALYESYADHMHLEREWQPVQEALSLTQVPLPPAPQMAGPGQFSTTTIEVQSVPLEPSVLALVESEVRTDEYVQEYEVTLRRPWTGEIEAQIGLMSSGWK